MPLSIKVNLRVTGHCNQGGRKYMEDMFSVAYQQTSDDKDLEYAFFGIFDGHGGGEAATFAKENLMDIIVKQKNFWSDKDEDVLRAIRDGYVNTHYAMWRELEKWPRTASGLPSTAGTTASIAFIRKGKIYIGHVGDSGIILGYQEDGDPQWKARPLTKDHKPESIPEMSRIQESGGKVINKSGVPRVVWNRPRIGHKGPVRRSTHIDEIPFLAVARSLGDLWSYNSELDTFVVSPEPDVKVVSVDVKSHRCLIFGTDGLWNMLTPQNAVSIVQAAERHNEKHFIASQQTGSSTDQQMWINPSKSLVDRALEKWSSTRLRADNTSVVTLMLDPPGPSRGEVLMNRKKENISTQKCDTVPILSSSLVDQTVTTQNEEFNKTPVIYKAEPVVEKEPILISPQINQPQLPIAASDIIQPDQPAICENNNSEIINEKIDNIVIEENTTDVKIDKIPEVLTDSVESFDEATTSVKSENIQDPEISSSDLVNCEIENNNKIIVEDKTNEPVIVVSEKPDSPTKNPNEIPTNESTIENLSPPSSILSPEKPKTVLDKSINDCDKFKLPLSKLVTQPNIKSPIESRKRLTTNNSDTSNIIKISTSKTELRSAKRRLSINSTQSQIMPATSSQEQQQQSITSQSTVESRNSTKDIPEPTATTTTTTTTTKIDESITSKRRHSSTLDEQEEKEKISEEPLTKRRTRSEDQRCLPTDENNPINKDKKNSDTYRLRWPNHQSSLSQKKRKSAPSTSCTYTIKDNNEKIPSPTSSFQRRSLEKKATPVKTIRRPSINGSNKVQLRSNFALRDWDQSKTSRRSCPERSRHNRTIQIDQQLLTTSTPQRWLRSDTIAATPIKTLRSRNVDIAGHTVPPQIAHQYGIVKQNRIAALSGKIKLAGTNKIKTQSIVSSPLPSTSTTSSSSSQIINGKLKTNNVIGSSSSSNASPSIAKRVKSIPYNPRARSLGTRSRLKRLGK